MIYCMKYHDWVRFLILTFLIYLYIAISLGILADLSNEFWTMIIKRHRILSRHYIIIIIFSFQDVSMPSTRSSSTMGQRKVWDSCEGTLLFDVNSSYRVTQSVKNGYFDKTFYKDQKNEWKLRMMVTKVIKEIQEEELQRKKKEAVSQARMISAMKETLLP